MSLLMTTQILTVVFGILGFAAVAAGFGFKNTQLVGLGISLLGLGIAMLGQATMHGAAK